MHNFEIKTAQLFHNKRPAIIPGMDTNAGNKALSSRLWTQLHNAWMRTKSIEKTTEIALWFLGRYPARNESCIIPVVRHFELLMGIGCETDEQYNSLLDNITNHINELKISA
jgi:hypothetical protein